MNIKIYVGYLFGVLKNIYEVYQFLFFRCIMPLAYEQ